MPPIPVAESLWLGLATTVAHLAGTSAAADRLLASAFETLAAAHARDAELPRALLEAALRARGDKGVTLALAWAREQLRLALQEVIEGEVKLGRARTDLPPDTLAWLALAACEAMVHEPPGGAADRVRVLLDVVAPSASPH